MTIDVFRQLMVFILGELRPMDKNVSPEEFDYAVNAAQLKYYKTKLGLPEEYQSGMPLPRQAYPINQLSDNTLRRFKVLKGYDETTPLSVSAEGYIMLPNNFYYLLELTYSSVSRIKPIELVTDQEWAQRIGSVIKQPSKSFPIANLLADKLRVYPKALQYVNMVYLRLPNDIHFAYKDDEGFIEYDPDNSVQFEWGEIEQLDILSIVMEMMGVNLKRGELYQYADKMNKEGV